MADQQCTPESLLEMRWVSDPQIAPDGQYVAYVEHWIEQIEKNGKQRQAYRSAIYLSTEADASPRRLTYSNSGNDSAPRWSPDGREMAFVSTRDDDKPQLFVLSLDGGEAQQVTTTKELSEGVAEYDWHPSGTMFCFTSNGHMDEEAKKHDEIHDEKVYENRLPFKYDGAGLLDDRRSQLYRINRDGSERKQITAHGRDVDSPVWSPGGRLVAFVSQSEETPERKWIYDIFVVGIDGGEVRQLTGSIGPAHGPTWSADGNLIAFLGNDNRQGIATTAKVYVVDLEGSPPRCLTDQFSGEGGQIASGDSHIGSNPRKPLFDDRGGIVWEALVEGRAGLYRVPVSGGELEQVNTSGLSVIGYSVRGNVIAFTGETNARSAELYVSHGGHGLQRRSHAADAFFSAYQVRQPSHVRFKSTDDVELEGWLIKPVGTENGGKHPLIVYVHGGPHTAYGNGFFHEFQVLAAAGFGLFYTNPRGSSSYGEDFAAAVRKHFGEQDFEDIMAAADYAAQLDWVDPQRMGIMGGSYGGFMTNWAITHTDRFAAACAQRSITNLVSFAGTSDIGPEFSLDEFGPLPWQDEELLMAKSPMRYVQNVKTPTLILHQEQDHRCPIEQGEQLYTALVMLGVPTKFVRFPDEGHEMPRSGQPQRRVNRLEHIVDWFTRYLKPQS